MNRVNQVPLISVLLNVCLNARFGQKRLKKHLSDWVYLVHCNCLAIFTKRDIYHLLVGLLHTKALLKMGYSKNDTNCSLDGQIHYFLSRPFQKGHKPTATELSLLEMYAFPLTKSIQKLPLETKNTLQIEHESVVLLRLFISSNEVCNTAYTL